MHENPDDPAAVTPREDQDGSVTVTPHENPDGSVTVTSHENPDGSVTVTPCEDGPLLLRGAFTILTQEGRSIDPGRTTVALCRCGRSATKPFCDGSHKAAGFRASSEPDSPN